MMREGVRGQDARSFSLDLALEHIFGIGELVLVFRVVLYRCADTRWS